MPTTKDLQKIWSQLPHPFNEHTSSTTLLIDDSMEKAHLQPYNHICIPDYTYELRSRDLEATTSSSHGSHFDETLLGIIGVIEELRSQEDVTVWLQDQARKANKDGHDADLSMDLKWLEKPEVLSIWAQKGRSCLQDLEISLVAGV